LIVVDASVVANALGDDGPDGTAARAVLRWESRIAAPDLMDPETVSVLRKRWLAGALDLRRYETAIDGLRELRIVRYSALPFLQRTYQLRANLTPYDALYVALAETLDCTLVTSDRRLASAPGSTCEIRIIQT
jgi:predicted nucleic acid-binding protein